MSVVTRFAPSPTGYLHIGGARTALFCYLLAQQQKGKFILRIEDTDLERSTPEAVQAILDGMNWLGLNWDEGPIFQTKRFELYNQHIDKLVSEGKAYPCFCSEDELSTKRLNMQKAKIKYRYDRTCYHLSKSEREQKLAQNIPHCIRFYSTDEGSILIKDHIKGQVEVQATELDDLILRRSSDGAPTYNFTVVVDDALMGVTHVIRGDDHLNNTPRQIQMYEALGFKVPEFAHCSMILGDDKKKLSKRTGATSVMNYREMGYLPHALLNYLVRLGWSYKDQEIFSMAELIEHFSLDHVSSSSAVFDMNKLDWLNGHYIRLSSAKDLCLEVLWQLNRMGVTNVDHDILLKAVGYGKEKVKTIKELAEFIELFFRTIPVDEALIQKTLNESTRMWINELCQNLSRAPDAQRGELENIFQTLAQKHGVSVGKILGPARALLSGQKISPGVYEMMDVFGIEKSTNILTSRQL